MRAVGMRELGEPVLLEVPDAPQPQDGEVRVAVRLVAISVGEARAVRGDRFRHFGQRVDPDRPFIFGFAGTGIVAETAAPDVPVGERVVLAGLDACGRCSFCARGIENHCLKLRFSGIDVDSPGFMREYVTLPARRAFPIPSGLGDETACVAGEVATAVHALRQGRLARGESLAVVGAGRHGRQIIRTANRLGARRIVAIDVDRAALARAADAGANQTCEPAGAPRGASDVAVHANSDELTIALCCDLVHKQGRVVLLGTPTRLDVPLSAFLDRVVMPERALVGTDSKTFADFRDAIALMADGAGDWEIRKPRRVPLEQAPAALRTAAADWPLSEELFVELSAPQRDW